MQKITPMLWFNSDAEEAVKFYTSVFKNSKIGAVSHYGENAPMPKGTVMTIAFELDGQHFTGLNGGPHFKFNEAISFVVDCETQEEIDYYWDKLTAGGGKPVQCGWLTDKFGLSWQITPTMLGELAGGKDQAATSRMMQALLGMVKLDIQALQAAYDAK